MNEVTMVAESIFRNKLIKLYKQTYDGLRENADKFGELIQSLYWKSGKTT